MLDESKTAKVISDPGETAKSEFWWLNYAPVPILMRRAPRMSGGWYPKPTKKQAEAADKAWKEFHERYESKSGTVG